MGKCDGILQGKHCLEYGFYHCPIAVDLRSAETPTGTACYFSIIYINI